MRWMEPSEGERKIWGKTSASEIRVFLCFLQCSSSFLLWRISDCVCVRPPMGPTMINLACFCLCIIPSSVTAMINPCVRSYMTVAPLRAMVNIIAGSLRITGHIILWHEGKKARCRQGAFCFLFSSSQSSPSFHEGTAARCIAGCCMTDSSACQEKMDEPSLCPTAI